MSLKSLKSLKRKIDKCDVISFDIFDTLIKRNCCNPSDIFKIVEKRYGKKIDFYRLRKEAEQIARTKSSNGEVTLDDIYDEINIVKNEREVLKQLEIQTEIDYCQANYNIYDIYKYCIEKNKKVVAISNMYLSSDILRKILLNSGYQIEEIYVSCEYDCSKQKGRLFEKVFEKNTFDRKRILHIGDGFKPDYIGAKCAGIKSYKINRDVKNVLFYNKKNTNNDLSLNILLSIINNNGVLYNNYYKKLGFEIAGPICFQFVSWVNNVVLNNNFDNILFCARDMKLINDAYNELYSGRSSYFYVSRRSTYLPFLFLNKGIDGLVEILPKKKKNTSIQDIICILNLNVDLSKEAKKYKLDYTKKYDVLEDLLNDKNFVQFYEDVVIKYVVSIGTKQYICFTKYLEKIGVGKQTCLVDLGWRGTTQKILSKILGYDVKGLYFGLIGKHKEIENKNYTFLFNEENKYADYIYPNEEIIELMFSSIEGSTIGYNDNEETPYILNESMNKDNKSIIEIQDSALRFIKLIKKYIYDLDLIESKFFIDKLIDITCSPSLKQAEMLGNLYSEDYEIKFIAKPKPICKYLLKPKNLIKDFANASWKIGFLKRIFKIKLPYFKLFKLIKKMKYGNR